MTMQPRHLSFNVHVMPSGAAYWVLIERRGLKGDRVLSRGCVADAGELQAPGDLEVLELAMMSAFGQTV